MKFNEWIASQGEFVWWSDVTRYLDRKTSAAATATKQEIIEAHDKGVLWIPSAVYKDDFYRFEI